MIHIQPNSVDSHPAAIFGLLVGTLAVLVAVLVFSIYDRAQQVSQNRAHATSPQLTIRR